MLSHETAKANVLAQRNKFMLHHESTFFTDSNQLHESYPVTIRDVIELLRTAQTIIGDYTFALNGSRPITLQEFYVVGVDNMYNKLRLHNRREANT